MKKEFAREIIDYIKQNPRVHYDQLIQKFADGDDEGRLYRLLYGLKEKEIIVGKDTMISPTGKRGLERNIFWINKKNYKNTNKLNDCFIFWKLGDEDGKEKKTQKPVRLHRDESIIIKPWKV